MGTWVLRQHHPRSHAGVAVCLPRQPVATIFLLQLEVKP